MRCRPSPGTIGACPPTCGGTAKRTKSGVNTAMLATAPRMQAGDTIEVNGVELYHEVRGRGAPVLFISGAGGDAGQWGQVADLLADEFTVVTYDRRGNSRSTR